MRPKDLHGLNLTDVVWGHSVSLIRPTVDVARHNSDLVSEPTSGSKKPANQGLGRPTQVGLYTILLLPILYGI